MAQVQGLEPCSLHSIAVSSCDLTACTAATPLSNERTAAATAPSQTVHLVAERITQSTVSVKWSHPEPAGLAYKYYVKSDARYRA